MSLTIIKPFKISQPDKKLIDKCIRSSKKHCFAFYNAYSPVLYPICLRYGRGREEAEDMLQESFIQIFNRLDTYEYRGSFEGWLAKTTVRTCINLLKSKLGRWNTLIISEEPVNVGSIEMDYIERETLGELVAMLPTGMRTIFNLTVIEGYNHAEISEMLNINESSSRAQLAKARARLKDLFQKSNLA